MTPSTKLLPDGASNSNSSSHTTRPGGDVRVRRRRRRVVRKPSDNGSGNLQCFVMVTVLVVTTVMWIKTPTVRHRAQAINGLLSSSSFGGSGGAFRNFPEALLDLWPRQLGDEPNHQKAAASDSLDATMAQQQQQRQLQSILLQSCLPSNDKGCHERYIGTTQHVAILHPPSVLSNVLQDYVIAYIEQNRNEEMDMVVKVHSAAKVMDDGYTLTHVIRPSVLPILLEAVDLIMETTDVTQERNGDTEETSPLFTMADVNLRDLTSAVRLLIRWHCHVSSHALTGDMASTSQHPAAEATALYSLSLHEALIYPQKTTQQLAQFLRLPLSVEQQQQQQHRRDNAAAAAGSNHHNDADVDLDMNDFAETVMHRIDECSRQLSILLNSTATITTERAQGALQQAVAAELQQCSNDHGNHRRKPIRPDEFIPTSRVTQLLSSFLGDGSWSATSCRAYPRARLCQSRK